jgi:hypothetical protein
MSPNIRTAMSGGIVTFEMKEAHLRLLLCASVMRLFCICPPFKRCSGITLLIFSSFLQVARGLFLKMRAENTRTAGICGSSRRKKTAVSVQKLQGVVHKVRKSYRNCHSVASSKVRGVVVRLKKGAGRKELVRSLYIGGRRTSIR